MKEVNTNLIRNIVKKESFVTKQKLSELSGLSTVTIGSILQILISTKEVYESELVPSNGGRPAHTFCYNYEFQHGLILFFHEQNAQDTIFIRVVNLLGKNVYKEDIPFQAIYPNTIQSFIKRILKQFPAIKAIGFGMPGIEYQEKITDIDYKSMYGTQFIEDCRNMYQIPIIFENDVNAAVAGYCHTHKIKSGFAVIYIYFPDKYHPGAGIYINHEIYKGAHNFAGEIKNLPLDICWQTLNFDDFNASSHAIGKLLITIISLLNPIKIILSGNFMTKKHIDMIYTVCSKSIPKEFLPDILQSKNYHHDFESGMVTLTLKSLEPKLSLTKNK